MSAKLRAGGLGGVAATFLALVCVTLLLMLESALFWSARVEWPVFPDQVKAHESQVVMEVARDFGSRIGDPVPVTLYIKQQPGTVVDLHSIAIEGNFEIRGEEFGNRPRPYEEVMKDGSKRIRFQVELQSFSVAPSLKASTAISYKVVETNDEFTVTLPALVVTTSNTWDKQDRILTGKLPYLQGWHLVCNSLITLAGLFAAAYFYVLYRRYLALHPEKLPGARRARRFVLARKRFDEVWAKIEGGDVSTANYVEIERIVRSLYEIESKTTREAGFWFLYGNRGPYQAVEILHQCDRVIYLGETLTAEDHQVIRRTFDKLVPHYPASVIAEASEIVASPSLRRRMREQDPANFRGRREDDSESNSN